MGTPRESPERNSRDFCLTLMSAWAPDDVDASDATIVDAPDARLLERRLQILQLEGDRNCHDLRDLIPYWKKDVPRLVLDWLEPKWGIDLPLDSSPNPSGKYAQRGTIM